MKIEFSVCAQDDGKKLGNYLRKKGVSLSVVRSLKYFEDGILRNGSRAKTNELLCAGDRIALNLRERDGFSVLPQVLPIEVVYESKDAIVLNKPAGQAVHPCPCHREQTLANAFCAMMQARGAGGATFRPIGRLDVNTSGLVLVAMHEVAAPVLTSSMEKQYIALVCGKTPDSGVIDAPLAPVQDSAIMQHVHPDGKPSVTEYQTLARGESLSLVRVWPKTGRTHQIRVHLSHIGHPLVDDTLYGGAEQGVGRHALHCERVSFREFSAEQVLSLHVGLPDDIVRVALTDGISADVLKSSEFA